MSILIYKVTNDDNGAPCIHEDILSLAICKPGYRKQAIVGDWLFGFKGRSYDPQEPLLYAAQVNATVSVAEYYGNQELTSRPDCIYEIQNDQWSLRHGALYHNDGSRIEVDLGSDRDSRVILSNNFRYFGNESYLPSQTRFPNLKAYVHRMTQTNAPWGTPQEVVEECESLIGHLWSSFVDKVNGQPTSPPNGRDEDHEDTMSVLPTCSGCGGARSSGCRSGRRVVHTS